MALLIHSGMSIDDVEQQRPHFETCPDCKRKQNIIGNDNVSIKNNVYMNKSMIPNHHPEGGSN
ncbi:hydrogenase 4 subunit H [Yersinia enterocolitica]|nr:hydrogenase 4 subunit H [Yersinia enterocolitica]